MGAIHFGGHLMVITTESALKLIGKYFKHHDMGLIKEPLDVDFVIDPRPLTKEEENAISEFIKADKEKRLAKTKRVTKKKSKRTEKLS